MKKIFKYLLPVGFLVVCIVLFLNFGTKKTESSKKNNANSDKGEVSKQDEYSVGDFTFKSGMGYSSTGIGFDPNNLANNCDSALLNDDRVLIELYSGRNQGTYYSELINLSNGRNIIACDRPDCTHTKSDNCIATSGLSYLCTDGDSYYGIDFSVSRNEIIKINGNDKSVLLKAENEIYMLWLYNDWFYYSTDEGICKVDINGNSNELISNDHISYAYAAFVGDTVYYIDDTFRLCSMKLDGSEREVLVSDINLYAPIYIDEKIYMRTNGSSEGIAAGICCYDINDGSVTSIIESDIYRFGILDNKIYYVTSPTEESFYQGIPRENVTKLYCFDITSGTTDELLDGIRGNITFLADSDYVVVDICSDDYAEKYLEENPDAEFIEGYEYYSFNLKTKNLERLNFII